MNVIKIADVIKGQQVMHITLRQALETTYTPVSYMYGRQMKSRRRHPVGENMF